MHPRHSQSPWPRFLAFLAFVLLVAGCATSAGLVNMWKDPDYSGRPLSKVYVIAVRKDPAHRRIAEDAFVTSLAKRGVTATQSYREFPDNVPDTSQVERALMEGGYDGAIVISRLDNQTYTSYVPGYVTTQPYTAWNPYRRRYDTYYSEVVSPGYTETNDIVRHRVDVSSPGAEGRLIWTGVTEVVNPSSAEDVNREMVNHVLPELEKQGILPKKG